MPAVSPNGPRKWCRLAVSDITDLKRAEDAQLRLEALTVSNKELKQEIVQRLAVEQALRQSELEQRQLLTQARHMHAQLRHFSHQILQAQEEERKRISRELHDEIAQTLVGISVHLKAMTPEVTGKNQAFLKTLIDAKRLVEKSVDVVHRFARDLRPTLLDDLGLIPALHAYMKEFTTRTKVRIHFTAFAGVEQLGSTRRTVLYRVTQSALTNIAQHAQATQVKVSIHRIEDTVRMEIQDDGKAFDVERVLFAKRYKRLGLLGMRERVEMVGGSFSVESTPGKGTIIRAQIPFGNAGKRRKTR